MEFERKGCIMKHQYFPSNNNICTAKYTKIHRVATGESGCVAWGVGERPYTQAHAKGNGQFVDVAQPKYGQTMVNVAVLISPHYEDP